MTTRRTSANRNETFGRLLSGAINSIATYEGKTAPIIEEELGTLMHVAGKSVQRYKAGHLPPEEAQVKVLAEAAMRRGFLGREWLQRFLHVARYPFADKLLDQLCPIGPVRPRPPHVYENLPAPTYSQFVMREQAFANVLDGLQQRSAVVLIVGLGGNGKTSLAREVAAACLKEHSAAPRFDAVVWVSDKDRPGTTNLSTVLDEVARTLDYPGFTQFEHEEKRREVEQLLRRQRVLLVMDNFETATDGALLTWLLRLPEPSKALITSRERHRGLWSSWLTELRGMSETEAQTLIQQRLRVLQLYTMVNNPLEFEPLVAVTGGNPKALEIALGLVKYEHRSLQQVVDDLYASHGDLFNDLFARAWSLLNEAARSILLVMTFFPTSASDDALATIADIQRYSFEQAIEQLTYLALLDVQQADLTSKVRYTLHPLVQAFAKKHLMKEIEFERDARARWIHWYIQLVSKVGYCITNLSQLELLDNEQEAIISVARWSLHNHYYVEAIQISKGVNFYYYVRGFWEKKLETDIIRMKAAQATNNTIEEIRGIAYYVEIMSKQDNHEKVGHYIQKLYDFTRLPSLQETILFEIWHALFFFLRAQEQSDQANQILFNLLNISQNLSCEHVYACRWLARCLKEEGKVDEALSLFHKTLQDSIAINHPRSIVFCKVGLASIQIEQGQFEEAARALADSRLQALQYRDRDHLAQIQRLYARLHILSGDFPAALASLTEAIDLFERLGMRRELTEARQALADLETNEAPVA